MEKVKFDSKGIKMAEKKTNLKVGQRLWIVIPWGFEPYEYELLSTKITRLETDDNQERMIYTEGFNNEEEKWNSQYLSARGIGNIKICLSLNDALATVQEYERGYK
ncbi:MAG: hypothetical protein ACRCZW_12905 [Lactobacillaceae bacterium]